MAQKLIHLCSPEEARAGQADHEGKPIAGQRIGDLGAIFKSKALIHTLPFPKLILTHAPCVSPEHPDVIEGKG